MLSSLPDYWFNQTGKTQRRSVATTGGSVVVTYADYLTNLPMRIVPAAGGEANVGDRLNTQSPNTIYVNGDNDILATDRVVFNGRVYDIDSVNNPDEQGAYMILGCHEVQPSGVGA